MVYGEGIRRGKGWSITPDSRKVALGFSLVWGRVYDLRYNNDFTLGVVYGDKEGKGWRTTPEPRKVVLGFNLVWGFGNVARWLCGMGWVICSEL